jgi:hypothetical protein
MPDIDPNHGVHPSRTSCPLWDDGYNFLSWVQFDDFGFHFDPLSIVAIAYHTTLAQKSINWSQGDRSAMDVAMAKPQQRPDK